MKCGKESRDPAFQGAAHHQPAPVDVRSRALLRDDQQPVWRRWHGPRTPDVRQPRGLQAARPTGCPSNSGGCPRRDSSRARRGCFAARSASRRSTRWVTGTFCSSAGRPPHVCGNYKDAAGTTTLIQVTYPDAAAATKAFANLKQNLDKYLKPGDVNGHDAGVQGLREQVRAGDACGTPDRRDAAPREARRSEPRPRGVRRNPGTPRDPPCLSTLLHRNTGGFCGKNAAPTTRHHFVNKFTKGLSWHPAFRQNIQDRTRPQTVSKATSLIFVCSRLHHCSSAWLSSRTRFARSCHLLLLRGSGGRRHVAAATRPAPREGAAFVIFSLNQGTRPCSTC